MMSGMSQTWGDRRGTEERVPHYTVKCGFLLLQLVSSFVGIEITVYPTESNFIL